MSDLARQRIRENIEAHACGEDAAHLNLSKCGMTEVPEEIEECVWLETLILSMNNLQNLDGLNLPKLTKLEMGQCHKVKNWTGIKGLSKLKDLSLHHCNLKGVDFLAELTSLKKLTLSYNEISDIQCLEKLINLEWLDIEHNLISSFSFVPTFSELTFLDISFNPLKKIGGIERLKKLEALSLRNTGISEIKELEQLTEIRRLSIRSNEITDFSPLLPLLVNKKIPLLKDVDSNPDLLKSAIFYNFNPWKIPPIEILHRGDDATINYFRERDQQGTDTLYEAKLLVVGEGGAGKTSLIRRLYQPDQPLPPKEDTTKGIDIHRHDFAMPTGKDFRLNVWDFGGQEIYHATHQFFLTKRSLYVLLDNSRSDHKTVHDEGFRYWLEVIDNLSEHSPVLMFQNMDGGRSKDVDMPGIKGQFDNVKELYRGDLLHDPGSVRPLREAVEFYVKNLPHIGEQLPKKWIDIRRDLEVRAEQAAYISLDGYFDIYRKHLPFDRDKALWLSRYLHDLGVFLHFQDEPALRKTVVLQNQWATEAVFKVLDDEQVKAARGRFTLADCDRIWSASTYADMHYELLALMMKFELCYQLRDTRPGPDVWLTPGLLSASKPEALRDWARPGDLVLRYHYTTFKPKGLPNRLMVRMNRYVQDISRAWRNGAYFQDGSNELLVEEPYNTSEIVLRVRGKDPKALLTLIAADLDALNNGFGSLREKVKKKIPCICAVCRSALTRHFYDYDNLLYRRGRIQRTAECAISFENVSVAGLLEGVFSKKTQYTQNQEDMPTPTRSLRAFFSYSKSDKALLEDFKKATAALRRQNLLEAWDDSRIVAGDEWDDEIKTALREADIIFLLLSNDFLDTDYIWKEEISEAMRRHEAREARVVPILLRSCDWKGTPFEKLQGLPRKGRYIASAPNADELWLEVAQGVRAVIEDFWKG